MLELLVAVVAGTLIAVVAWWALALRLSKKAEDRGYPAEDIPGWTTPPSDPRIGDLGLALTCGGLHNYLAQQHHGGKCPIKAFWWKDKRVVSVCSPCAFKNTENLFLRPQHVFSASSVPIHGASSIENVNGDQWKRKKKCLHKTIRGDRLESFVTEFVGIAVETRSQWVAGGEVALKEAMLGMTLKAILTTSLGNTENKEEFDKLVACYDYCKVAAEKKMLDFTPTSPQQEIDFQNNMKSMRDVMKKLLYARREQKEQGNCVKDLPLLDALLECGAPEEELVDDMVTFLGGFHTSGFYCMWVLLYLAQYPLIQHKIFLEITQKVGEDLGDKLKAYVLTSDSYLRQVLDEVLRMSSTVAFSGHVSDQDGIVEGYRIPANTPIIHAIGVAVRDATYWENPDSFQPDRFAPGSMNAKRGHEFRPFGISSTRRCPANMFVYTMVSVYVTTLIQHFVISCAEEGEVEKKYGIATSPKGHVRIKVTLRDN